MTRERTIEIIKVMQAYVDGKEIEFRPSGKYGQDWDECNPLWNWDVSEYRIKPGQDMVPWDNPSDVPPACWMRKRGSTTRFIVTSVGNIGIEMRQGFYYWNDFVNWEYSTDCEYWFPCTKKKEN